MRINLFTDAPNHNLALMKISAYHKARGDSISLNHPQDPCDLSYGSWLFDFSPKYFCDIMGGPACKGLEWKRLDDISFGEFNVKPDYDLFPVDFSLGYTWEYCPRRCGFCVVPKQHNPKIHRSIWEFHDAKFSKICLLNNNTFSDPQWHETFEEIWDAQLTVKDENGYDLRLMDEEKAEALKRTRFAKQIHFAWDRIKDEAKIITGLELAKRYKLNAMIYILMGYDTNLEQDLYRCQRIHDLGFDPFPMLYRQTKLLLNFRRFIYLRYYRSYKTIELAWSDYGKVAFN